MHRPHQARRPRSSPSSSRA
uniref:Uncharacterized protein n=1 Tax=Arundo donax TaxID=35708 RepID=A0A0A9Q3L3_ARUDO